MLSEMHRLFADDLRLFGYSHEAWIQREITKLRRRKGVRGTWNNTNVELHAANRKRTAGAGEQFSVTDRTGGGSSEDGGGYVRWLRNSKWRNASFYSHPARSWLFTDYSVHPRLFSEEILGHVRELGDR